MKWLILLAFIASNTARATTVWERANSGNPVHDQLKGYSCEVYDDTQGIPHVRPSRVSGATGDGALAVQACFGYIHGRDRAWQIDHFRRTAEGRQSEVHGLDSLRADFLMRILGLSEQAKRIFDSMSPIDQNRFWAYSYGVNRGINEAYDKGIYEFQKLGYQPKPWRPENSIELLLLQAFDQTSRTFKTQMTEDGWLTTHGQQARGLFNPNGLPWDTSILKEGEFPKGQAANPPGTSHAERESPALPQDPVNFMSAGQGVGEGSNNWVVAPARSASGHAWLANDPHLQLKFPPFWHWVHISDGMAANVPGAPGLIDAIGATLPGVPTIVSGANRHAGWGVTNSFLTVARLSYVARTELNEDTTSFHPLIWFKWWIFKLPFFFKSFERTKEGWPILPLDAPAGKAVVLRWSGFDLQASDLTPFFDLMASRSAAEADQTLGKIGLPSWNFVFADDQGKVGYRAVGRIPRREEFTDFGIRSMTLKEMRADPSFTHPLTAEEMPHVMNPARGFVVTANNRQWPSNSKFQDGRAHAKSFRAFRIEELIQARPKHDLESLQKMQCDLQETDARFIAPLLVDSWDAFKGDNPVPFDSQDAVDSLRIWVKKGQFTADLDCEACGIYRRWVDRLQDRWNVDLVGLYRMLGGAGSPRNELQILPILKQEIVSAVSDLEAGMDTAKASPIRKWEDVHFAFFKHLAGDALFTAKPISTPGSGDNVNPGTETWIAPSQASKRGYYEQTAGASQRLLVEFTSPPTVYSVLAGSNQDLPDRDLSAPGSAWQDWVHCRQQKREFPLDWDHVKLVKVEL